MPNIDILLQALAGLPQVTSPLTPPFVPPNATVPLTTAGQAPVPQYGGPSQVVEPPQAPLDLSAVRQLLATQAPPPTPPPTPGRAQRIFNAIGGFGAGVQGNLPQYLEQLQRPQREYQQQLRDWNAERSRLAQGGIEIGLRQQEAKTRRAQEVSDRELEAEVRRETRRLNLSDAREQEMLRDVLLSRRQREDDERAAAEKRRVEKAQQERDARLIARDYGKLTDNPKIALELGRYYAGLTDTLSPQAAKFESAQNRLAEARALRQARIAAGGGTPKAEPEMAVLENGDMVPSHLVDKSKGIVRIGGKPVRVVKYTGGKIPAKAAAPQGKQSDPLGIR